jgi:hypothetical protein
MPGTTSLRTSSHFPADAVFEVCKTSGVATRPGEAGDEAGADGIRGLRKHNRHSPGRLLQRPHDLAAASQDDIGCKRDQFHRVSANAGDIAPAPAVVEP